MATAAVISLSSNEMPCAFQQPQFKTPPLPTAATKETKKSLGTFRDELLGIRREDRIRRNKKGSKFVYFFFFFHPRSLPVKKHERTGTLFHFWLGTVHTQLLGWGGWKRFFFSFEGVVSSQDPSAGNGYYYIPWRKKDAPLRWDGGNLHSQLSTKERKLGTDNIGGTIPNTISRAGQAKGRWIMYIEDIGDGQSLEAQLIQLQ